jgi:ferredoxin
MKVQIDKNLCVGDRACVEICPEIFVINDGVSAVKNRIVPDSLADICRDAVEACPACAIILDD